MDYEVFKRATGDVLQDSCIRYYKGFLLVDSISWVCDLSSSFLVGLVIRDDFGLDGLEVF